MYNIIKSWYNKNIYLLYAFKLIFVKDDYVI